MIAVSVLSHLLGRSECRCSVGTHYSFILSFLHSLILQGITTDIPPGEAPRVSLHKI